MIQGRSREAEILASLNVVQNLIKVLRRKGLMSEQETDSLLEEAAAEMRQSPLVQAKSAAEIIEIMKTESHAA